MKIVKKLVAAISAIGLVASVSASLLVVQAAEYATPKFDATVSEYSEETGEGTLTISVTDLKTGEYEYPYMIGLQFYVGIPSDEFDTSMYAQGTVKSHVNMLDGMGDMNKMMFTSTPAYSAEEQKLPINWTYGNMAPLAVKAVEGKADLYSIDFKVLDVNQGGTITLSNIKLVINAMSSDSASSSVATANVAYANEDLPAEHALTASRNVVIEGGDVEIVIPPATGVTATGGQLLNLKPSDIGLEGDEWTTEDPAYADEKAVVSLANVKKDDAITGFTWEIKATDAEGNPLEKTTEYFKAGNIESAAEVTVGLVVGYDTTEWQSVEIVGVTAE